MRGRKAAKGFLECTGEEEEGGWGEKKIIFNVTPDSV